MAVEVEGRALHPLSEALGGADLPLAPLLAGGALDGVYALSAEPTVEGDELIVALELAFEGELALSPPGIDAIQLVLGSAGVGWTGLQATVTLGPSPAILLEEVTLSLRLRDDVLRDVATDGPAEISVSGDLRVSADGVTLENFQGASLRPAHVADTEVVVEAQDVRPVFGPIDPPGWLKDRPEFEGLAIDLLAVTVPDEYLHTDPGADLRLELTEAAIDRDGFSGDLTASAEPAHPITGDLFGFPFRFLAFELDIDRNAVEAARLAVELRLTALEDGGEEKWVGVEAGFAAGRTVTAALSAVQPPGASADLAALVSFEVAGLARLGIRRMALQAGEGAWSLVFSGTVTVLVGGDAIRWPAIDFEELGIGSDGRLVLPAGGIRLRGSLAATLGPVSLRAGNIGVGLGAGGALTVTPPREIGVAIKAPAVSGGGYLSFDADRGEYSGSLALEFAGFSLSAIGMLITRPSEFSLLVVISVRFSGVQLGFGFTLNGVGGLVAINRGVALDAIESGLKGGGLDAVMFPPDPVRNAPQLLKTLDAFFPAQQGQYVVGPSVVIGWGTPTLVTITLGILIEFPSPVRLLLVGRLRMVLPDDESSVAVLQMDVLGSLDFTKGRLAIDATLRNSRVAQFALGGDVAIRASWGEDPGFLFAAGGFHPRFKAPTGLRRLERLSISLGEGDNPRLRLESYVAVTSNTVQFGARLELYASADIVLGTFSVAATVGFDALFQFSPKFSFVVDIYASIALKWNGDPFMGVSLAFTLSGPEPWRAVGEATFDFLGTHTVRFELTIGEEPPLEPPELVDVLDLLRIELEKPGSWEAQRPSDGRTLVTLRGELPSSEVIVHPLGAVTVRQRVVPLEREIVRFGSGRPKDATSFKVVAVQADGSEHGPEALLDDFFARAQFYDLDDAARLAAPSFEPMPAAARFGAAELKLPAGGIKSAGAVIYDEHTVDVVDRAPAPPAKGPPAQHVPAEGELLRLVDAGAAARNGIVAQGTRPLVGKSLGIAVQPLKFAVAALDGMGRHTAIPVQAMAFGQAAELLEAELAREPQLAGELAIVGAYEVPA